MANRKIIKPVKEPLPRDIYKTMTRPRELVILKAINSRLYKESRYNDFIRECIPNSKARREKLIPLPVAADSDHPRVTTVEDLFNILVETQGYKYI